MADAMMFWFAKAIVEFLIVVGVMAVLGLGYAGLLWWLTKK